MLEILVGSLYLSLTSSMNVEFILERKDGTSSEEMDLRKGKYISGMTTLMHQYVSVCHGGTQLLIYLCTYRQSIKGQEKENI